MIPKQAHQLRCDNVTCYSTVLFELQELLQYINPDSPAGKIIARRYNELWELRKGCATHSAAMTEHSIGKGELEYGTVSRDGVDWRLRRFDAGMGETEYRIFRNETFFAQFDNRDNADDVMEFVTGVHDATHSAAAEKIILCFGNYWTCPIDEEECKVSDACHQKAIHDREHDAAIRSKECERLLKKFDTLAETKWFAVDVGDPDGNVCVVSTDDIENLIKSLREGAP